MAHRSHAKFRENQIKTVEVSISKKFDDTQTFRQTAIDLYYNKLRLLAELIIAISDCIVRCLRLLHIDVHSTTSCTASRATVARRYVASCHSV